MIDFEIDIDSEEQLKVALAFIEDLWRGGNKYHVAVGNEKPKTDAQRAALHVWCRQLAQEFNAAGLDMKRVLREEVDISWSEYSVKEFIYKPVLKALTGKESTEKQNTVEPSEVYSQICRLLGQNEATAGMEIPPWPTRFNQMERAA